ncbi:MAG: metal-dependent hydrolase [Polyangiales bacterium]
MASIGHVVVGMAAARVYRQPHQARCSIVTAMAIWAMLSLLPDADVLGFRFGIRYGDTFGHRGATHSLLFAGLVAAAIGGIARRLRLPAWRTTWVALIVVGSHGLLDTLTDGGLGCALFWPFSAQRYFAPWNPIPVAPIGRHFFSAAGLAVALEEAVWFAPLLVYALWPRPRTAISDET